MSELIFLLEAAPDGGWVARGLGESIFTEADTLDELRSNVRDAVSCHFGEGAMPAVIRLHIASERTLADRMAEVLGKPELGRGGTSNWSEVEAACDAG